MNTRSLPHFWSRLVSYYKAAQSIYKAASEIEQTYDLEESALPPRSFFWFRAKEMNKWFSQKIREYSNNKSHR